MSVARKAPLIYDTTLRDGTQASGANISLDDKLSIIKYLVDFSIPYIEAGWPGSNPKDQELFARLGDYELGSSQIAAFGATRKANLKVQADPQIQALLDAKTPCVTLVAKSWDFHVTDVLGTQLDENLAMIYDSIAFFKDHHREVILDAEHFFDAYHANPDYALACLDRAKAAGADTITLCDTNGGQMPEQVAAAVVQAKRLGVTLGIHCHNDCELAVANSLAAWRAGVDVIQGTMNGYGERCGNANLCTIIPNLQLKYGQTILSAEKLTQLSHFARQISNHFNIPLNHYAAYVGDSAFAHKGGIHVSAVAKNSHAYEHVEPEQLGNERRILISELSGAANIKAQVKAMDLELGDASEILQMVKELDHQGIDLEEAEASFAVLVNRRQKNYQAPFHLLEVSSHVFGHLERNCCQGIVKLAVGDEVIQTVAEADGPVEAIDKAFRLALQSKFPAINQISLTDYKVRIVDPKNAAAATTRVWIEARCGNQLWNTVGCSCNIIQASSQALNDSFEYFLSQHTNQGSKIDDDKAA